MASTTTRRPGIVARLAARFRSYQVKRLVRQYKRFHTRAQKIGLIPPRDPAIIKLFGINDADAGVPVDEATSYHSAAYFSGIHLISSCISMMPCHHYEQTATDLQIANDSLAEVLVSHTPNGLMSPTTFFYLLTNWALGWGNGYAEIERNEGLPTNLIPIHPQFVHPEVPTTGDHKGELIYKVKVPGEDSNERIVLPENMIHIFGYTQNGLWGETPLEYARKCLSITQAAEQFGASFFANSATMGGFIEHPLELSAPAAQRLQDRINDDHGGPYKAHKMFVLDEGMTFKPTTIPPEDAQFLQTRQFQVLEIARLLRVPPNMLYDVTANTFNNVEQSNLQFLTYTLTPWMGRWASELKRKLIVEKSGINQYFAFDTAQIQTQDTNTRFDAYGKARNGGWYSLDDILSKEKMPLIGGELGKSHIAPSTMKTLERTDFGESVDIATLTQTVEFFKASGPVTADIAREFIDGVIPAATKKFTDSLIKLLQTRGLVSGNAA